MYSTCSYIFEKNKPSGFIIIRQRWKRSFLFLICITGQYDVPLFLSIVTTFTIKIIFFSLSNFLALNLQFYSMMMLDSISTHKNEENSL